jgi:Raf kinase inhibitor-like YbhB/YbcL family protein
MQIVFKRNSNLYLSSTQKFIAMRSIYKLSLLVFIVVLGSSFMTIGKLTVTSSDFTANGMIPSKFTCEGDQTSPALNISGAPSNAKSLALILNDPDAPMKGGFTHWVMWNINLDGKIPQNFKGASQGFNGAKKTGYIGMCPPTGVHHYHFMVYALDTQLTIDPNTDKAGLEKAMQGHILAQGEIVGLYQKTGK